MKKLLITNLLGFLSILALAQDVAIEKANIPAAPSSAETTASLGKKELRKASREKAHFTRTTKAFERDFENASGAKWSSGETQHTVSFTQNGIRTVAWYTKNGSLLYTMLTYGADKLPARETAAVEYAYDGYTITSVNEVHQAGTVVYVVTLENDRHIKLVTVCNGDINIYREYRKP